MNKKRVCNEAINEDTQFFFLNDCLMKKGEKKVGNSYSILYTLLLSKII